LVSAWIQAGEEMKVGENCAPSRFFPELFHRGLSKEVMSGPVGGGGIREREQLRG